MTTPRPIPRGTPLNPWQAQKTLLQRMGIASPVVFDVGAHHGETIRDYRTIWPDARIVSFEPDPRNFQVLSDRCGQLPGVTLVNAAVSDHVGTAVFFVNEHDATHSLLPRATATRRYYPTWAGPRTRIDVGTTTLDAYAAEHGIDTVHVLKLDIQGGELLALAGADRTLRDRGVLIVHTEAFFVPHYDGAPLLHDLWRRLAELDFSLLDIHNLHHARNGQLRFGEALFVHGTVRHDAVDPFELED